MGQCVTKTTGTGADLSLRALIASLGVQEVSIKVEDVTAIAVDRDAKPPYVTVKVGNECTQISFLKSDKKAQRGTVWINRFACLGDSVKAGRLALPRLSTLTLVGRRYYSSYIRADRASETVQSHCGLTSASSTTTLDHFLNWLSGALAYAAPDSQ